MVCLMTGTRQSDRVRRKFKNSWSDRHKLSRGTIRWRSSCPSRGAFIAHSEGPRLIMLHSPVAINADLRS